MTQSKTMLMAAALGVVGLLGLAPAARAQCSAGDYLGTCDSDIGFAGCCPNATSIMWCEGALLCGIDCSGNQGAADCCAASEFAGCGSAAVEACVCAIDDYCCDIFGAWDEFCVAIATDDCAACAGGGAPPIYCGWLDAEGFYECREAPSADPTGAAPRECATCAPACAGRACGDDGCGGSCGSCGAGKACQGGQCVTTCTPQCTGKTCGDDGCGGLCGQCLSTQTCVAGQCQAQGCTPQCAGRECGSDGCLGTCGSCAAGEACVAGQCEVTCTPACDGRACGADGCGGSCGACRVGESCQAGACIAACVPDCAATGCGDDGCGGSCGTCADDETCEAGACVAACSCVGRECGDDGCGRTCGFCVAGTACNAATHLCEASSDPIAEKAEVVGPETCPPGQVWNAYAAACVVDTGGFVPARGNTSDSGCEGGHAAWPLALVGLAALTGRRSRRRRAPTR